MRLAIATSKYRNGQRRADSGFTLAEVLAALLFLAIVIPAAVEVLQVASLAGEVAARKSEAVRVADRVLSESIVTTNWMSRQSGTISEGILDFRWIVTSRSWTQLSVAQSSTPMQLVTAQVTYSAQGKDYSVSLSTLASPVTSAGGMVSQ
jgi:type II secretory pathway pseudopilin PulG